MVVHRHNDNISWCIRKEFSNHNKLRGFLYGRCRIRSFVYLHDRLLACWTFSEQIIRFLQFYTALYSCVLSEGNSQHLICYKYRNTYQPCDLHLTTREWWICCIEIHIFDWIKFMQKIVSSFTFIKGLVNILYSLRKSGVTHSKCSTYFDVFVCVSTVTMMDSNTNA